jgi:hypothetical protein
MKLIGIILIVILSRFLILLGPGWANFSPLGAFALYAGYHYYWKGWIATGIGVVLSNILVNNLLYTEYYNGFSWGIDANVIIFVVISITAMSKSDVYKLNTLAAVMFFAMSNLMVWGAGNMYTHDVQGLIKCYTFALPFFPNTIISQFIFSAILFGIEETGMFGLVQRIKTL